MIADVPLLAQLEAFQTNFDSIQHLISPWYVWPQQTTVHMVVNNVHERDGVGNFVIALYKLMQRHGVPCQLYAEGYEPYLADLVYPLERLADQVKPSDIVIVHFSIYLPQLEQIAALTCCKVLCFYGITPPEFLAAFEPTLADQCQRGYDQGPVTQDFELKAAISEASAVTYRSMLGGDDVPVAIIPPVLDPKKWDAIAATASELPAAPRKFLYVGRVVPHKKIEDLIHLYGEYAALDPDSCLLIAGFNGFHTYQPALQAALESQSEAVRARIHFLGSVTDGQLKSLYQQADAFWMMSEHEGFCIPLLEAMAFDLPVFAFAQTAVRETLAEAGLVFYQKDMAQLAQVVHNTLFDAHQLQQLLAGQRQRCQQLTVASDGRAIWRLLESCLQHIHASSI